MGYSRDGRLIRYGDGKHEFKDGDCYKLLEWDLERARADVHKIYRNINCLCARSVLVDILFHHYEVYREDVLNEIRSVESDVYLKRWTRVVHWLTHSPLY